MAREKTQYTLVATYPFGSNVTDRELRKAVNCSRNEGGSGFSLIDGGRDLVWYFNSKRGANGAAARIRKIRRRATVALTLYVESEDYETAVLHM